MFDVGVTASFIDSPSLPLPSFQSLSSSDATTRSTLPINVGIVAIPGRTGRIRPTASAALTTNVASRAIAFYCAGLSAREGFGGMYLYVSWGAESIYHVYLCI